MEAADENGVAMNSFGSFTCRFALRFAEVLDHLVTAQIPCFVEDATIVVRINAV